MYKQFLVSVCNCTFVVVRDEFVNPSNDDDEILKVEEDED